MADIFTNGNPYLQGEQQGAQAQLLQNQANLAGQTAADAARTAQTNIGTDMATRSALQSVYANQPIAPGRPGIIPPEPVTPPVGATTSGATAPAAGGMGGPMVPTAGPQLAPPAAAPAPGVPAQEDRLADRLAGSAAPNVAPTVVQAAPQPAPPQPALQAAPQPAAASATFNPVQQTSALRQALASNLTQVPGGGSAASTMAFQDLAAQTDVMHQVFKIAETDPQLAVQYAAQAGMPVPPQMQHLLQDRGTRQQVLQVLDDAAKLYPNERDAIQKWQYVTDRMRSMAQQPGTPTPASSPAMTAPVEPRQPRPDFQPWPLTGLDENGKPQISIFDPNNMTVTNTGAAGFGRGSTGGRGFWGNGNDVFSKKTNAWLSVHPGDQQGALDYAGGGRHMSPQDMMKSAHAMAYQEVANDPTIPPKDKATALQTKYANYLTQLQQADNIAANPGAAGGAGGQIAPAPVPGAAGGTGAPDPFGIRTPTQ